MECPRCGFIEQRDVLCPRCDGLFNANDAEEWAHLDYLEAKLGDWRNQGLLPEQKVDELLALTDAELATVEGILGIERDDKAASTTRPKPRSGSAPALDEDWILDAVDDAPARGDMRQAERLLSSVDTSARVGQTDQVPAHTVEQFAPIDSEVGLDMLFLVTADGGESSDSEYFRRAIVYAASPEEAIQRICTYIDLCNEADAAQPADDEQEEPDEQEESDEDQVVAESDEDEDADEDDLPIAYDPDLMLATLVATTTTRLDDENVLDADHILIFETLRND